MVRRTVAAHPTLPFPEPLRSVTVAEWGQSLSDRLDRSVRVVYGRSRTTPVRYCAPADGAVELRLHRMFAEAPPEVVDAVGAWLRAGRRARAACRLLDDWIEQRLAQLPARPLRLRALGAHHDLRPLVAELCAAELCDDFDSRPVPAVAWSPRRQTRPRHSLLLGSYDPESHVIRIHPVLDRADVPRWYLRFLLFHELLHAALPPRRGPDRRWVHHGPEFRRRERAHPDHPRAARWEKDNLPRLIQIARRAPSKP